MFMTAYICIYITGVLIPALFTHLLYILIKHKTSQEKSIQKTSLGL